MNLILSDRHLELPELDPSQTEWMDLSRMKIANCVGCYGCWTRTPGRCVIRDDAVKVYPRIAASDRVMYVSRVRYGGYDTLMKTVLERAIPIQQAFIRLLHGETHHLQRRVASKQATIVGYGDLLPEEQLVFRQLIARNARNMNFERYRVVFTTEEALHDTVCEEIELWKRS